MIQDFDSYLNGVFNDLTTSPISFYSHVISWQSQISTSHPAVKTLFQTENPPPPPPTWVYPLPVLFYTPPPPQP